VIVADTGAIVALIDGDDCHHRILRQVFEEDPGAWVLPWAVLPEVDHIVSSRLGPTIGRTFRSDLARGLYSVEWGEAEDLIRAQELEEAYGSLQLGLVDGVVMAIAERLGARAIATLDLRDFAPVQIAGRPQLLPRDISSP